MTNIGDIIEVSGSKLKVLSTPRYKAERDAAYYIVRAELIEGNQKGETGWLISSTNDGPWDVPDAGFV